MSDMSRPRRHWTSIVYALAAIIFAVAVLLIGISSLDYSRSSSTTAALPPAPPKGVSEANASQPKPQLTQADSKPTAPPSSTATPKGACDQICLDRLKRKIATECPGLKINLEYVTMMKWDDALAWVTERMREHCKVKTRVIYRDRVVPHSAPPQSYAPPPLPPPRFGAKVVLGAPQCVKGQTFVWRARMWDAKQWQRSAPDLIARLEQYLGQGGIERASSIFGQTRRSRKFSRDVGDELLARSRRGHFSLSGESKSVHIIILGQSGQVVADLGRHRFTGVISVVFANAADARGKIIRAVFRPGEVAYPEPVQELGGALAIDWVPDDTENVMVRDCAGFISPVHR